MIGDFEDTIKKVDFKSTVEFHAQGKFIQIMNIAMLTPEDITKSLNIKENQNQAFKAGQGAGMSGQFFFHSKDSKYIIKTVFKEELDLLLEMLDDMIEYFEEIEGKSLIAKIFGAYTIKTEHFVPVHIILMENII